MKICTRCQKSKHESEYGYSKHGKDNLTSYCAECLSELGRKYYLNNKSQYRSITKKYYENNKEIILEYGRRWYKDNKEKRLKKDKEWRENNKEYIQVKQRLQSLSNARYEIYTDKLTPDIDQPECGPNGELIVVCTYCGRKFIPTNIQAKCRVSSLNNLGLGERRFYCSESCKKACPIYHKSSGYSGKLYREVQPELRQLVLKRDNYTCKKCHITDVPLHVHHIIPVKLDPVESADMDNCITLCITCHKNAHTKYGCGFSELATCK